MNTHKMLLHYWIIIWFKYLPEINILALINIIHSNLLVYTYLLGVLYYKWNNDYSMY